MHTRLLAAALLLWGGAQLPALAQQEAHFTQWDLDKLNLNAAYAGVKGRPTASVASRMQWVGFEGAPATQAARFHMPLLYGRAGVGAALEHDAIGSSRSTQLKLAYAYRIELGGGTMLGLGLEGQLRQVRIDYSEARVNDLDPIAGAGVSNRLLPNVGAGVYLYGEGYYVGASVSRLARSTPFVPDGLTERRGFTEEVPHAYLMAGLDVEVQPDWRLRPGLLLKYASTVPVSADANAVLMYRERFGGGLALRGGWTKGLGPRATAAAVIGRVALGEEGILGLSYDLELSEVASGTVGGLELVYEHRWGSERRGGIPCPWH